MREPIAIIGIGCRFPGADNPASFWQLLHKGVDAITEVSPERWDNEVFYDPEPATPRKMNTRWGGFLEQVGEFDPNFFRISPREAAQIDPQHRLLLEVAWEALENAGIPPHQLKGSQTGVFVGISNSDYLRLMSSQEIGNLNAYSGTGNAFSIAANRLSYWLDLKGPSLAIDTACSSSLVAAHIACQSLHLGESNLCLVGGVNLILSPETSIIFSQARMMAADGRCKTFDASADGYVRGEGCGVVVLKRLSDALRDKDNIQAIIRGSAVNQDGLTNGITAPNGPSQQAVIRQALKNAEVLPSQISYVEAHGTGTPLGDPQEFSSLKAVLKQGRQPDQPCWIGSVKTNIGHLESAAGLAGIIKVVLSLQHREIPPHLHLQQLSRYISLEGTPLAIPTQCQPWEPGTERRLAGISSFGFGGTNAHLILEEASDRAQAKDYLQSTRPLHLLSLSAKSEPAVKELAGRYADYLANYPAVSLADLCFTANAGRTHFNHRLAVVARSPVELQAQLLAFAKGEESSGLFSAEVQRPKPPKIAFLFTGQGSQYVGMGQQLYETEPVFKVALDRCAQILHPYLDQPLLEVLYPALAPNTTDLQSPIPHSPLDETAYTQPALFALGYALAQLWMAWGIKPNAVMGHSVGEYVAACIAGVFSLEDGLKLIAHRARLMQRLPQNGLMAALLADEATVNAVIRPYGDKIAIAAFNGSKNLVISGEKAAIEEATAQLQAQGIKTKFLQVSHAFHSSLMRPIIAEFTEIAQKIDYSVPHLTVISNVTGQPASKEIATPHYWVEHIIKPVQFNESLQYLDSKGYEVFLEIGSKPVLLGMGASILKNSTNHAEFNPLLPSLRPGKEDWQQMLESLASLDLAGVPVDWVGFAGQESPRRLELPTYPFQRQRYWFESSPAVSPFKLGAIEQISEELAATGEFTEEEVTLLPKFLAALAQHQQPQKLPQKLPQKPAQKLEDALTHDNGAIASPPEKTDQSTTPAQPQPLLLKAELLAATPEERQQRLKSYFGLVLAKITGIAPEKLEWQQPLANLGIDSLMATELRKRIETDLDIVVPVEFLGGLSLSQFFEQVLWLLTGKSANPPQPSALETASNGQLWFPQIQPNSPSRFRLFCFPYAGGGASIFQSWRASLPPEIEICPIQLPGRENRLSEAPFKRIKPLIEALTPLIQPYLDRPFGFFGYSLGAILAFELARQLHRQNAPTPESLFVAASIAPQIPDFATPIHGLADAKFIEAIAQLQGTPKAVLQDAELMQLYLPALRADFALLETYFYTTGEPLNCPIVAFGGLEDKKVQQKQLEAWQEQTKYDFTLKMFSGDHFFFHPSGQDLLQIIVEKIKAQRDS